MKTTNIWLFPVSIIYFAIMLYDVDKIFPTKYVFEHEHTRLNNPCWLSCSCKKVMYLGIDIVLQFEDFSHDTELLNKTAN